MKDKTDVNLKVPPVPPPVEHGTQKTPDGPVGLREDEPLMTGEIDKLILQDHLPLKALIETLKNVSLSRAEKSIALENFVFHLTNHAQAEQETLYVQMREFKALRRESFAGLAEHQIA